jgi:hypothetical protein
MSALMRYVSTSAGRDKVVKNLERFTLAGGAVISAVLFLAVILR